MLKCNLAVLLAERKLKISKVSADTGISRTTLTALSSNQSQGIQFDTLNTLCSYLRVTPAEFFCYAPFEVKVKFDKNEKETSYVNIFFNTSKGSSFTDVVYLFADVELNYEDSKPVSPVDLSLSLPDDDDNLRTLRRYMIGLSPIFKRDIEQQICEVVYNTYFDDGYEEGDCVLYLQRELKQLL